MIMLHDLKKVLSLRHIGTFKTYNYYNPLRYKITIGYGMGIVQKDEILRIV